MYFIYGLAIKKKEDYQTIWGVWHENCKCYDILAYKITFLSQIFWNKVRRAKDICVFMSLRISTSVRELKNFRSLLAEERWRHHLCSSTLLKWDMRPWTSDCDINNGHCPAETLLRLQFRMKMFIFIMFFIHWKGWSYLEFK